MKQSAIDKQMRLIDKIHQMGKEALMSSHVLKFASAATVLEIAYEQQRRGADIVMYGHTHRPVMERSGDMLILNPGSVSYPRQQGRERTYMVMEINEDNVVNVELKCVD